jgi:biopolymer transport protein ExbB
MKRNLLGILVLSLLILSRPVWLEAGDMRVLQLEASQARAELVRKASQEKTEAENAAAASRARISQDKDALQQEIARFSGLNDALSKELKRLAAESEQLVQEEKSLDEQINQIDGVVRELVGVIRSNAKDLSGLIGQNGMNSLNSQPGLTGQAPGSSMLLDDLAENEHFPPMDKVRALHETLFDQIRLSGEVSVQSGTIISRPGLEIPAEVLFVGPFAGIYRTGEGETGFLNYSAATNKLYALGNLPPRSMRKNLESYMNGDRGSVIVDISQGAALRQLSYRLNLWDQVLGGGPIVWPILAILVVGLLIVAERTFTLIRKHHGKMEVFDRLKTCVLDRDWSAGEQVCNRWAKKPLARVLLAGVRSYSLPREDLENVLQEAILREIPALERCLSTLGMLVAIAPLLGLLGTVTGMINVFHVITLNGTGDPRLMSGGISEALVTTMLGLGVAIPLMLLHNALNRTVDRMASEMEEKGVALVNLIHKSRNPA